MHTLALGGQQIPSKGVEGFLVRPSSQQEDMYCKLAAWIHVGVFSVLRPCLLCSTNSCWLGGCMARCHHIHDQAAQKSAQHSFQ